MTSDICTIYLLRHGATESNLAQPPRFQGHGINHSLHATGRGQAERTAKYLANIPFDAAYSSPLLRARETAEMVLSGRQLGVTPITALEEVHVGRWEGHTWEEIGKLDPEGYRLHTEDPAKNPYGDGETLYQVQERDTRVFDGLAERHVNQQILVVAHTIVNRAFLAGILGMPLTKSRVLGQDNCGVNIVRCHGGEWRLVTMNDARHLQP